MTSRRSQRAAALAFGALFAIGGCSEAPAATPSHSTAVVVNDSSITPTPATVAAGDVTLNITNNGTTLHEVEVFTLPAGVDVTKLEVAGHIALVAKAGLTVVDEIEGIVPGATPTLTVNLAPGTYALLCNLPGHYALGVRSTITVR